MNLISRKVDPECGCLEEEWDTEAGYAFIHLKPDGEGEIFFDNGENEWEITIKSPDIHVFRKDLKNYISQLPISDSCL